MLGEVPAKRSVMLAGAIAVPVSIGCGLFLLRQAGHHAVSTLFLVIVIASALVAEFLPVAFRGRRVGVSFTLPYVATLAFAWSGRSAFAVELGVTLLFAFVTGTWRSPFWAVLNLCLSAIGCFVGFMTMLAFQLAFASPEIAPFSVLAFMLGYGASNFVAVTWVECLESGRPFRDNIFRAVEPGIGGVALFALTGLLSSVLARDNLAVWVPLTLVPIWALRTGLSRRARMSETYYETVTALTMMLQRAHPYTHGHVDRVARTAEEVAHSLGLPPERAKLVRAAAVLHDIGKIAVDEAVLDKPGPLTADERLHVQNHPVWGAQIVAPVKQFHELVPWIRHHHERPDGTGYPDGLSDVEIPIESKIIAVVDAFDAMTGSGAAEASRSYREPKTQAEALMELRRCSGTQFDAAVVTAFCSILTEGAK